MERRVIPKQRGTTLIETMVATAICMIVVFGLAGLVTMSTRQAKDMGSTASQATTLAAQKMERLMALSFGATTGPNTGDSGLTPTATNTLNSDTAGYVDYVDANGQRLDTLTPSTAPNNPAVFFTRRWRVEAVAGSTTLKVITVQVQGRAIGRRLSTTAVPASAPSVTLGCLKSDL